MQGSLHALGCNQCTTHLLEHNQHIGTGHQQMMHANLCCEKGPHA